MGFVEQLQHLESSLAPPQNGGTMGPDIGSGLAQDSPLVKALLDRRRDAMHHDAVGKISYKIRVRIRSFQGPILAENRRRPTIFGQVLGKAPGPVTGDVISGRKIKSHHENTFHGTTFLFSRTPAAREVCP